MTSFPPLPPPRFVTLPGARVPKWDTSGAVLGAIVNLFHLLCTASFSECHGVLCTCGLDQAYGRILIFLTGIEVWPTGNTKRIWFAPLVTGIVIPLWVVHWPCPRCPCAQAHWHHRVDFRNTTIWTSLAFAVVGQRVGHLCLWTLPDCTVQIWSLSPVYQDEIKIRMYYSLAPPPPSLSPDCSLHIADARIVITADVFCFLVVYRWSRCSPEV